MLRLAIIIVSHNTRDDLAGCLRSLAEGPPAVPHEIVVVDSGSIDGSVELVRREWPKVHVLEAPGNVGFACGCNLGVRASASDLVLLLNADTTVPPGAIDRLIAALEAHPDTAAVGPRLLDGAGRAELSYGAMSGPWSELRQKVVRALAGRDVGVAVRWLEDATSRPRVVDWVSGACLLTWRRDAEAAGLLDERYFMYFEDVDFCAALRARGRLVRFEPAAVIVHYRGRAAATAPSAVRAAYRRSQLAFYAKHHPRWRPWLRVYLALAGKLPAESADKP